MENQYKRITIIERQIIQEMLDNGKSFSEIARSLGRHPSSISAEVGKHASFQRVSKPGLPYNNCKHRFGCSHSSVCEKCNSPRKHRLCRNCSMCNKYCPDYEADVCTRLSKPPYVCNGCGLKGDCSLEKKVYAAIDADRICRNTLTETRSGISLTEEELAFLDAFISPLLKQGQSPHSICTNFRDALTVSERTVYNLVDSRLISARNLDLPRKVRYYARKTRKPFKIDKSCRIGRDFQCFKAYLEEHPDAAIVQLDSVLGKQGGKVLLTIHFVKCEMMLAFLRDCNNADSVIRAFELIYQGLGPDKFKAVFPVLLADNGSEFSDPSAIEFDKDGNRRTTLFYCDPQAPYQKGSAERNHEFIRCFFPKSFDFSGYSQHDITLMMDHINSYSRESLGGKSPYEVFRFFYGNDLLDLLGCTTIPAEKVTLNRSIFNKETSL